LFTLVERRDFISGATLWTNSHSKFHTSTLQDAILPRVGTTFDGPLWSLHWEILFSLSLPLYVAIARAFKRWNLAKVLVILAVVLMAGADAKVHSTQLSNAILYAPMFGVGVFIAFYESQLVGWFKTFMGRSGWNRIGLFVIVAVLGDLTDEISPIKGNIPGVVVTFAHGVGVVGAALIILMILSWAQYSKVLESKPIDWIGQRSFSLYLIHDSILIIIALALGGHPNPVLLLALVIPSCLVGITIFYRLVERPSQNLSNYVGRAAQKWADQRRARRAAPTIA